MKFGRTAMAETTDRYRGVCVVQQAKFFGFFFWRWKGYFIGKEKYVLLFAY